MDLSRMKELRKSRRVRRAILSFLVMFDDGATAAATWQYSQGYLRGEYAVKLKEVREELESLCGRGLVERAIGKWRLI